MASGAELPDHDERAQLKALQEAIAQGGKEAVEACKRYLEQLGYQVN